MTVNYDKESLLEALKQDGWAFADALRFASEELRADKEVVLEVVKQDGRALQFASEELRADKEIVLEFASKKLRADKMSSYADTLTEAEWSLSKSAIDNLSKLKKAQGLIKKYQDKLLQLKQIMFEIRFAAAINKTGCTVQNEYKAGIGNTDVDFKVTDLKKQEWLIELTSPSTSIAVKENTEILESGIQQYSSITSPTDQTNSPEVRDIIKAQSVILSKVANDKGKPIKFPLITDSEAYHIIVISINSFNSGVSDKYDYINIVYGSTRLRDIEDGVHVRCWYDQQKKCNEMIKGVFDPDHSNLKAKILQKRVHAIVFIKENFEEESTNINLYVNPNLENEATIIESIFAEIAKW